MTTNWTSSEMATPSSSTTTIKKQQRRRSPSHIAVTFQASCSVLQVPSHREYSDEEYRSCWYDEHEMEAIMDENVQTVFALRGRDVFHGFDYERDGNGDGVGVGGAGEALCGRGLEALMDSRSILRKNVAVSSVVGAVLHEQRQCRLGLGIGLVVDKTASAMQMSTATATTAKRLFETEKFLTPAAASSSSSIKDPLERIGRASRRSSSPSVMRAVELALRDELYVRRHVERDAAAAVVVSSAETKAATPASSPPSRKPPPHHENAEARKLNGRNEATIVSSPTSPSPLPPRSDVDGVHKIKDGKKKKQRGGSEIDSERSDGDDKGKQASGGAGRKTTLRDILARAARCQLEIAA